jgi:hypothetical protein
MPERPHAPEFRAWPRGTKGGGKDGVTLFSAAQIEAHRALELIDRGLRLALANERGPGFESPTAGLGGFDSDPKRGDENKGSDGMAAPSGSFRWDGPEKPRAKPLPWGGPRRPDMAHLLR